MNLLPTTSEMIIKLTNKIGHERLKLKIAQHRQNSEGTIVKSTMSILTELYEQHFPTIKEI